MESSYAHVVAYECVLAMSKSEKAITARLAATVHLLAIDSNNWHAIALLHSTGCSYKIYLSAKAQRRNQRSSLTVHLCNPLASVAPCCSTLVFCR